MHFIYIIYTPTFDRYYVGESIDPSERVSQHNKGFYKGSSTSFAHDWQVKLVISVGTKEDAITIECYIKSMKSKAFIIKLISDVVFLREFKRTVKKKFEIDSL